MARRGLRPGLLEAQRLIEQEKIACLPVDPMQLAKSRDILVEGRDCGGGVSGMLIRHQNAFAIVYATDIPSAGFQRFSVAHELGHYFMPGHPEKLLGVGDGRHRSQAEYASSDPYEREADEFATGLLMPAALVRKELVGCKDGFASIERLAASCGTSLVSSAIRYTDVTAAPIAVIVSRDEHIDFCFCSEEMFEFSGIAAPRAKSAIPRGTVTERFHRNVALIERAAKERDDGMLRDWFGGGGRAEIAEEVVGLGTYGRVLTVLTAVSTADDQDEEGETEERWAPPRFR